MKHIVISRLKFDDRELMSKYLAITKAVLIPALKSQIQKNFTWALIINPNDEGYLKKELGYPFVAYYSNTDIIKYLIENKISIQTRHDCDDYMSKNYIKKIQDTYISNVNKLSSFLIQAQPTKLIYDTGIEHSLPKYHEKRCSMFLSICQKNVKNHIFERKHGQMYEISENIITLPEGYTKWVIHGNNKSLKPIKK